MTLSAARAAAADAIRAALPDADNFRVVEVEAVAERDIVRLADGIYDSVDATHGDRGPAVIAVMALGRQASQAVNLAAYTIVRTNLAIELAEPGRSRGISVVDTVEAALSGLPAHGLPRLLVESASIRLPATVVKADATIHVYATRCTWPAAAPTEPLAVEAGTSTSAIRDHVAGIVETELPAAAVRQRGRTEAERRAALIADDVPRAWITLHTQRETIGGSPDFVARESMRWFDGESPPREWRAQAVTQTVVVVVAVAHRTESLADEAAIRIFAALEGTTVNWPGSFDARVDEGGVMVTRRLSGGDYQQDIRPIQLDRAEWDAEAGVAVARLQVSVEAMDPIEPATQSVGLGTVQHDAEYVRFPLFDAGTVRQVAGSTLGVQQWSVEREPVIGGSAQVLRLRVSSSRVRRVRERWQVGTELVLGSPAAPVAVLEAMGSATWARDTGTADVILLAGTLPAIGVGEPLRVRDG